MYRRRPRKLPPIISAQGLAKRYGAAPLFRNISFTVSEGDRIGVIGPNGSGKSTLLEILIGRVKPDSGDVAIRKGTRLSYVSHISEFAEGVTIRSVSEAALDDGANRHALSKLRNLRDVTEPRALANRHIPAVRLDAADEDLQQRRLARTIRPNHADAVPFRDSKRNVPEERGGAVPLRQSLRADDRRQFSRSSPIHSLTLRVMATETPQTAASQSSETRS